MLIRFKGLPMPFFDEVDAGGGAGVEESEAAEPTVTDEQGAEEPEVAEPGTGKTDADARFAQMRRDLEQAQAKNKDLEEALGLFFEGDTDQKIVSAQAMAQNKTEEEIRAEIEAEKEREDLEEELAQTKNELLDYQTKAQMDKDLAAIQAIDPTVKDLDSLGKDFLDLISTGKLTGVQAYYAAKAKKDAEKATPPAEVGKVNQSEEPKDYFSKEEVEAMTPAEVKKHYDTIRKSMSKW